MKDITKLKKDNGGVSLAINSSFVNCTKEEAGYMDYKTLALITLESSPRDELFNTTGKLEKPDFIEDNYRVLYVDDLYKNMKRIEQIYNSSSRTIKSHIKKLKSCKSEVVSIDEDVDGRQYYTICPYINRDGEYSYAGTYVTIERDILKSLIHTGNNNMIRTYIVLKWLLSDGKEHMVTRDWLVKQIGLQPYEKNLQVMTDILKVLHKQKLISRRKVIITTPTGAKTNYYYKLVSYEAWKEYDNIM